MTTPLERPDRPGEKPGRSLLEAGYVSPDWASAFAAVPRSAFLPDLFWSYDMESGGSVPVSRTDDPDAWERKAFEDVPLVTQWDDGHHSGTAPGDVGTSSASMPSVVAGMLRDLDVHRGMRVLEIGTGTGWNAGLLAKRLGSDFVTSVELDEQIASQARLALRRILLHPTVVRADGTQGHTPGAPYDRIIATAGVRSIPPAWPAQTTPGGVILAPWGTYYSNQEALVRLTVDTNGNAHGPFLRLVEFMTLRNQRIDWSRFAGYIPTDYAGEAEETTSTTFGIDDLGDRYTPQLFVTGLCVPRCAHVVNRSGDGVARAWFFDMDSRSWAAVESSGKPAATVYQSGPRRLWDEVARALTWWSNEGSPGLDRFGLTISADGTQQAWLDDLENVLAP